MFPLHKKSERIRIVLISFAAVVFVLLGTTQTKADITSGLFLNYDFNSSYSNSTVTNDSVNLSKYANVSGATYNSTTQSYDVDGTNDYFNLSTFYNSSINTTNNYTINFWVKYYQSGSDSGSMYIISSNKDSSNKDFDVHVNLAGRVSLLLYNTTGSTQTLTTAVGAIPVNGWNMVTIVYDNVSSRSLIYVNSILKANNSVNTTALGRTGTSPNLFFCTNRGTGNFCNGSIDGIRMYSEAKNEDDIRTLYYLGHNAEGMYASVTLNTATTVGTLQSDFYGTNTHGQWGSNYSWIDTNGDGTLDTYSNYTWHRNALSNASIKIIRVDARLNDKAINASVFNTTSAFHNGRNIQTLANITEWAYNTGRTVLVSLNYMPPWLANISAGCSSDNSTCPASDWEQWNNLTYNFIYNISNGGQYVSAIQVEVWNEPDGTNFWMKDTATSNSSRETQYNILYNNTYNTIKNNWATMKVGGPGISSITSTAGNRQFRAFIGNFSNRFDFLTVHNYTTWTDMDVTLANFTEQVLSECALFSANCSKIYLGEWNTFNDLTQTTDTDRLAVVFASGLSYLINNRPSNWSQQYYEWSKAATTGTQSNAPNRYECLSEPLLANSYYKCYNITKNFATYVPSGSTIYNSTWDSNNIIPVYSTTGTTKYVTITNKANFTTKVNVTISGLSNQYRLIDQENGTVYSYNFVTNRFDNITVLNQDASFFELQTDTTFPQLLVQSPINGTNYGSNNITVTFNVTDGQGGLDSVWYNNGTANITVGSSLGGNTSFNYTNTTIVSSGNRTFTFYANDTLSQLTTTTVTFSVGQIAFNTTSPSGSTANISAGTSQVFLYTLDNPAGLVTNTNWYNEGVNITTCYNATTCTITSSEGDSTADYNISVNVTSSSNNLTRSWTLYVTSVADTTRSDICRNGSSANAELASWMPTIALVIAAVTVVGIISLYNNGSLPSIGISDLGGVAVILVVAGITISIAATIIVNVIC